VLDSGGYVRYDFSTASNLLKIMEDLIEKYGDLEGLHEESSDPEDLERRLREFKGFGPVGVNIFLRELRGRWEKAKPKPSRMAVETAQRIGLSKVEPYESALVRLNLEYCKKRRCGECPVQEYCKERSRGRPRSLRPTAGGLYARNAPASKSSGNTGGRISAAVSGSYRSRPTLSLYTFHGRVLFRASFFLQKLFSSPFHVSYWAKSYGSLPERGIPSRKRGSFQAFQREVEKL